MNAHRAIQDPSALLLIKRKVDAEIKLRYEVCTAGPCKAWCTLCRVGWGVSTRGPHTVADRGCYQCKSHLFTRTYIDKPEGHNHVVR